MKRKTLTYLSVYIVSGIILSSCAQQIECKQGINLVPMYGNIQKCKAQLDSDKNFLELSDKHQPDRATAAIEMLDTGWYYIHQGDYDAAIKRVNQAWLLDSTNIAIYASFAVILDLTLKTDDAINMLDYTFNKINSRKEPTNPTQTNPSNETFIEFIISNAPFTYKKTNNANIGKYLYKKLDSVNIRHSTIDRLKDKLKTEIPELS